MITHSNDNLILTDWNKQLKLSNLAEELRNLSLKAKLKSINLLIFERKSTIIEKKMKQKGKEHFFFVVLYNISIIYGSFILYNIQITEPKKLKSSDTHHETCH